MNETKEIIFTQEDGTIWTVEMEEHYRELAEKDEWERCGYECY